MGDYTPVPGQPADLPDIASAEAGQIATASPSADPVIPADSSSQPVQASSPVVEVHTQANSQIPADSTPEATASASSAIQPPASIAPSDVISPTDIPVTSPVSDQPEVAPEQVFEASASATVAPQENTPIASDSIVQNSQPNPLENPPVQPPQNTPEIPVISIGQNHQEVAPQPTPQPTFQPVEATKESSIHDSSQINPPIYVQPDVSANTPSVSSPLSGQTQQESAEIKPEPLQPVQNSQTAQSDVQNSQKTSFGDLMGDKIDIPEVPSINIEPIEAPVLKPEKQPPSQVIDENEKQAFSIRRQHAVEVRKQKYADHLNSVIELVQKKGNVDNLDVRDFLHVSQTTATDYLHTLVNSGKLKKDGKAKATTYSLV